MELDIAQTRYCYYRDAQKRPMVTVAMVVDEKGQCGYGWAICSADDHPQYGNMEAYHTLGCEAYRTETWLRGGRTIAYGRAVSALTRGVQIAEGVWRYRRPLLRAEAVQMVEQCEARGVLALAWHNTTAALPITMQPLADRPPRTPRKDEA